MSTPDKPDTAAQGDKLAQLLAKAGPRVAPPLRIEAEVRAAVHAEWVHLTQSRKARQQRRWLSAAAVFVCAVGAGWLANNMRSQVSVDPAAATPVLAAIADTRGTAVLNDVATVHAGQIHGGDVLRTRDDGGLRIDMNNGVSVRVAANTELQWLAADSVRLTQGAIYVDSHSNAAPLVVHTPRGDVTHLGTRYLVDVEPQSLRVAVREGQVAIHADNSQVTVDSLQQLQMGPSGEVVRGDIQLTDAMWHWADALAQPFVMENRSVAEFLQWVANETGCDLRYASPEVKAAASGTVLHGQPSTQVPLQTMQAVLAATDFRAVVQGRQLVISQQH